ncbi:MAG: dephospho-CoA kinase [Polaribacter sp.]|uniref:dephospho-CoA kinase n=1 Tax=Polaribacter sp. TaxID=1920175 RepID=UPI00321CD4E2
MIVGLTGGIGSGKTTVAKLFSNYANVAIYIADVEAKKLINSSTSIKQQITKLFGANAYKNNILDRKYIGQLVFNSKAKLQALNKIVHPAVKEHFVNFVQSNQNKDYILYESAILFESNSIEKLDFIISVYVDLEERIERVMVRDSVEKKEVLARINNQWKEDKILLLSNYLIINSSIENTKDQVRKIHNILTKKALHFL